MASDARSFVDVVQDALGNIQDIVASEVRLAKAELTAEAKKAIRGSSVLIAGAIFAIYSLGLLLLAGVYGLATVIPIWGAALVVFGAVTVIAAGLILAGCARLKQVHPKPETTVESIKENVQWLTNQTR